MEGMRQRDTDAERGRPVSSPPPPLPAWTLFFPIQGVALEQALIFPLSDLTGFLFPATKRLNLQIMELIFKLLPLDFKPKSTLAPNHPLFTGPPHWKERAQ